MRRGRGGNGGEGLMRGRRQTIQGGRRAATLRDLKEADDSRGKRADQGGCGSRGEEPRKNRGGKAGGGLMGKEEEEEPGATKPELSGTQLRGQCVEQTQRKAGADAAGDRT